MTMKPSKACGCLGFPTNISASPVQGKANLAVGSPGGAQWRFYGDSWVKLDG